MINNSDIHRKYSFLWLPKTINGATKWLVSATWEEHRIYITGDECGGFPPIDTGKFKPVKWL